MIVKKIFVMFLAGLVAFSAASCSKGTGNGNDVKDNDSNDVNVQTEEDVRKVSVFAQTEEGDAFAVSADVFYPADADIAEDEYAAPAEAIFNNETLNYAMTMTLCEDSFYESSKEYAMEEDTYNEFKVGKYKAFGHENYTGYYVNIHFEKVSDETDRYMEVYVDVLDSENDCMEGVEFFEDDEIAGIINSVVYNGVVPFDIQEAGDGPIDGSEAETALFLYGYDELPFTIYKPGCASFMSEPEAEGRDMITLVENDNAWVMDIWGAVAFDYGEATDPFANYYFKGSLSELESEYYEIESQNVKNLGVSFDGKPVKRVETVIRDIEDDEVSTDVFVGFELESTNGGKKTGVGLVGFQLYMYEELPSDDELAELFCEVFGV